ncbi:hypothetical protein [Halobellus sp. GM3]|uniref:hypothetical protein n=1 Tax=Halobellus sp. GM3 TaxID=3458410 RepID=UPI00403E14EC
MSDNPTTTETTNSSREELLTQLELLNTENQELYNSYVRAKHTQYRRTAIGLGVIGVIAAVSGVVIPSAQTILLSLAGVGVFGSVLTLYLTPEQFIAADTGRDVYLTLASNEEALTTELGLTDDRIYVPTGSPERPVVLFVPQVDEYVIPEAEPLTETIIATEDAQSRGVAFTPSGSRLFESFQQALAGSLAETPAELGSQLTEALTTQFELLDSAQAEVDTDLQGLTVIVSGSAYGPVTRFDHPVVSFIATGLAHGLECPVTISTIESGDTRADYRIRFALQEIPDQADS